MRDLHLSKNVVELNLLEVGLVGALICCFFIQIYFSLFVHLKLALAPVEMMPDQAKNPISVIICARNEVDNLRKYLPSIFDQNYPNYEVIVVNDRSWDGTAELLETFEAVHKNLKVVTVVDGQKFIAGKKFAVTMGIKAASHEWLVFTDADCQPQSNQWLMGMQQPENEETEILLGYSPYFKKGGLLNSLVRFETFFTAVNYLSFALKGMPYMGVGRNLAYKKSMFFRTKGFAAHMHIPSGDDDLFVNANATATNTQIRIHKETHVWSEPKTSFLTYLRQKKRHVGAGKFYQTKHRLILTIQVVGQFLFYGFGIVLLLLPHTRYIGIAAFALSILIRSFVYPRLLKKLSYGELSWWFPILDLLLFVFLMFNSFLSIFVKKVKWK